MGGLLCQNILIVNGCKSKKKKKKKNGCKWL